MNKSFRTKLKQMLVCLVIVFQIPVGIYAGNITGNPEGKNSIPPEACEVDVSKPDHIIGTGTPESCTAEAFIKAVAQGGTIVLMVAQSRLLLPLKSPPKYSIMRILMWSSMEADWLR